MKAARPPRRLRRDRPGSPDRPHLEGQGEGQGEVKAFPVLIRRVFGKFRVGMFPVINPPRSGEGPFLSPGTRLILHIPLVRRQSPVKQGICNGPFSGWSTSPRSG